MIINRCGVCNREVPRSKSWRGLGPKNKGLCVDCVPEYVGKLRMQLSQVNDSIGDRIHDTYRGYSIIISDSGQFGFNNVADRVHDKGDGFFYCHYKNIEDVKKVIDRIYEIVLTMK